MIKKKLGPDSDYIEVKSIYIQHHASCYFLIQHCDDLIPGQYDVCKDGDGRTCNNELKITSEVITLKGGDGCYNLHMDKTTVCLIL